MTFWLVVKITDFEIKVVLPIKTPTIDVLAYTHSNICGEGGGQQQH